MKRIIFLGLISILFISSCKKDDIIEDNTDDIVTYKNYYPMTIGNFWVYEHISVDTNGVETDMNIKDSVVIVKDTIIRSNTYYILEDYRSNWPQSPFIFMLRDSLSYIVNSDGDILFSSEDFNTSLYFNINIYEQDTLYDTELFMQDSIVSISVPSGTFECLEARYIYNIYINNNIPNPRIFGSYYSENTGLVLSQYAFSSSYNVIEKRLINYQIN